MKSKSRQIPLFRAHDDLVVDLFAGGGGASLGIEAAIGRPVDIAINHDPTALAVHCSNHPLTKHMTADIWDVKPLDATGGRPVWLLWASPDCRDFSVAKGGKPRDKKVRSLAWAVIRWAKQTRPSIICLENVIEFQGWGPLDADGRRIKERVGETFRRWKRELAALGYVIEHRVLNASHYGVPTRRRRFFLVARCDGQPIVWDEATHGPGLRKMHTAAECIDWSIPSQSIFGRKKPLADKTLWRVAQGIWRFVLNSPNPFIMKVNHGKLDARVESLGEPLSTVTAERRGHAVVVPTIVGVGGRAGQSAPTSMADPLGTITAKNDRAILIPTLVQTGYGEREGQKPRSLDLHEPLGTVVGCGQKHALVSAFLAKHNGDPRRTEGGGVVIGDDLRRPIGTVTTRDHHSLVALSLAKFRGTSKDHPGRADPREPMPTITSGGGKGGVHVAEVRAFLTAFCPPEEIANDHTAKLRLGIVTIDGIDYQIVDITLRMLEPHELLRAQFGRFAKAYDMSRAKTKAAKVRLIGNSVPPEMAEMIVAANVGRGVRRAA